ncbi:MAG: J domain-containing protein [Spirochaetales bacterium]|nr:J domain-containing protein [Spirochaetales bacterium]
MSRINRKSPKRKKKGKKRHRVHTIKKESSALLVINNKPVRRKAIAKCTHILNTYKTIKQEIEKFEETDKPIFMQWLNSTFGARLTEIRELKQETDKREDMVNLVHFVKYSKNISFHQAYNLVQELMKDPEKLREELDKLKKGNPWSDFINMDDDSDTKDDWEKEEENDDDDDDDFTVEEDDEDFVDDFTGESDKGDDLEDEEIEELFFQFLSGLPRCEEILEDPVLYMKFFNEFKSFFFPGKKEENETPLFDDYEDDTRLKTLYRSLVLKLHPDNSESGDGAAIELWYKVQEAYRQKDLKELEKLNALQSFEQGSFSPDCPVSHILAVHADYKEQLKILRREIQQTKKHIAWNFSKREDKADIHAHIVKDISDAMKEELLRKSYFDNMINKWAEVPEPRSYQNTGRQKKRFTSPPEQPELPF